VLVLRVGAAFDLDAELLESGDALGLQAIRSGAEIAVDFGVSAGIAKRIPGDWRQISPLFPW
jgi:hypothetical protein